MWMRLHEPTVALLAALTLTLVLCTVYQPLHAAPPLSAPHAEFDRKDRCNDCHEMFEGVPRQKCLDCHSQISERLA